MQEKHQTKSKEPTKYIFKRKHPPQSFDHGGCFGIIFFYITKRLANLNYPTFWSFDFAMLDTK